MPPTGAFAVTSSDSSSTVPWMPNRLSLTWTGMTFGVDPGAVLAPVDVRVVEHRDLDEAEARNLGLLCLAANEYTFHVYSGRAHFEAHPECLIGPNMAQVGYPHDCMLTSHGPSGN